MTPISNISAKEFFAMWEEPLIIFFDKFVPRAPKILFLPVFSHPQKYFLAFSPRREQSQKKKELYFLFHFFASPQISILIKSFRIDFCSWSIN